MFFISNNIFNYYTLKKVLKTLTEKNFLLKYVTLLIYAHMEGGR